MVRVAGATVAFNLGVDFCAAGSGVFEFLIVVPLSVMLESKFWVRYTTHLENEYGGTLTNDETFTVCIERPRCFLWIIVEIGCETAGSGESSDGEGVDA